MWRLSLHHFNRLVKSALSISSDQNWHSETTLDSDSLFSINDARTAKSTILILESPR